MLVVLKMKLLNCKKVLLNLGKPIKSWKLVHFLKYLPKVVKNSRKEKNNFAINVFTIIFKKKDLMCFIYRQKLLHKAINFVLRGSILRIVKNYTKFYRGT